MNTISTHTSLAGRDCTGGGRYAGNPAFLLTRPSRDVTPAAFHTHGIRTHISTHTSLAGRDDCDIAREHESSDFYSHVPRGT